MPITFIKTQYHLNHIPQLHKLPLHEWITNTLLVTNQVTKQVSVPITVSKWVISLHHDDLLKQSHQLLKQ